MSVGITTPNLSGPKLVKDLIADAYVIAHVLGRGESMPLVKCGPAFTTLNDILERASITKTFSPYQTEVAVPLVSGQLVYTIGPSTVSPPPSVTAVRPVEVLSAYSRCNSQDLPVFVTHAKRDYDGIPSKSLTASGWVGAVYYQPSYPAGTIYVYPTPQDTDTTLYLTVMASVAPFTYLEEEVSLPPGYTQYLKYTLAKQVSADHGLPFGPDNDLILTQIQTALERNNIKPMPVITTGLAGLGCASRSGYDVISDSYRGSL